METLKHEYKGKLMTINELMEFSVVDNIVLRLRLRSGWTVIDALNLPLRGCGTAQKYSGIKKKELDPHHSYATNTTEESMKKGKVNHKMEELIEKRLLKKELEDF